MPAQPFEPQHMKVGVLTAALQDNVTHGALDLAVDGSFAYTPTAGFAGLDDFTYRADDGRSLSAAATVRITVEAAVVGVDRAFRVYLPVVVR